MCICIMYMYMYVCMCVYICIYIYIYIHMRIATKESNTCLRESSALARRSGAKALRLCFLAQMQQLFLSE